MADPYQSALSSIRLGIPGMSPSFIRKYGLDKLIKKAVTQNYSMNQLLLEVYKSRAFKTRFPGIRNADGSLKMSPSQYLQQENSLRAVFKQHGLGTHWYNTPKDLGKWISGGYTADSVRNRLGQIQGVLQSNPGVVKEMRRLYGVSSYEAQKGAMLFLLDPKKSDAWVQRAVNSSRIGYAARQAGFGALDNGTLRKLTGQGVSAEQASQAFMQAAPERAMLKTLAQRYRMGELSDSQIAASLFSPDPEVMQVRQQAFQYEKAAWQGGAGFAMGQGGGVQSLASTEADDAISY